MAIDSRQKRQNAAQVGCPLPVSVLPSGTIGAAVRYQVSWSYGGNITPPPSGGGGSDTIKLGYFGGEQMTQMGR